LSIPYSSLFISNPSPDFPQLARRKHRELLGEVKRASSRIEQVQKEKEEHDRAQKEHELREKEERERRAEEDKIRRQAHAEDQEKLKELKNISDYLPNRLSVYSNCPSKGRPGVDFRTSVVGRKAYLWWDSDSWWHEAHIEAYSNTTLLHRVRTIPVFWIRCTPR
jgi:hypothetical protein